MGEGNCFQQSKPQSGTIRAWLFELTELACGLIGLAGIACLLYFAPAILSLVS